MDALVLQASQKIAKNSLRTNQNAPQTGICEAFEKLLLKLGRSTRIRTLDPLVPNQVRYQTAPHSEAQIINEL